MDSRTQLNLALIGDQGVYRVQGHTWYYQFKYMADGSYDVADAPNGPAEEATAHMVWGWKPNEVVILGDGVYNLGASSHIDDNIGQFYNQYMSPYPSPIYAGAFEVPQIDPVTGLPVVGPAKDPAVPYVVNPSSGVFDIGRKEWVVTNTDVTAGPKDPGSHDFYILYNYPNGYPNPENPNLRGGSADGINHLWYTIGNHDWNFPDYTNKQPNVITQGYTPGILGYNENEPEVTYAAPNSVVDYFSWMQKPSTAAVPSLEIGNVDQYGDTGNYYTVTWGKTADNRPLVRLISIDVNRIVQDAKQGEFSTFDPSIPAGSQKIYNLRDPSSPESRDSVYEQYLWFKDVLQKDNAEWTIVIGHQPAYGSGEPPKIVNGKSYPQDEGTNAPVLKFLAADTEHKIDMYMNGHAHYYERVMESAYAENGLGLGVPSITVGGGGKNLDVLRYVGVLDPIFSKDYIKLNPQLEADLNKGVLPDTNPLRIAQLGIQKDSRSDPNDLTVKDGHYGFGASKIDVNSDYLYYRYQSAKVSDPAFVEALTKAGVQNPESWSPKKAAQIEIVVGMYQDGSSSMVAPFDPKTQGELFKSYRPTGNEGVYSVKILDAGEGYPTDSGVVSINMQLPGGSSEQNGAILKLTFSEGKLIGQPQIVDPGKGYWGTYFAIKEINEAKSMLLTLDTDLTKTLYPEKVFPGAEQQSDYYDYFLSTDTKIDSDLIVLNGKPVGLAFSVQPSNHKAEVYLDENPAPGLDIYRSFVPNQGSVTAIDSTGAVVGETALKGKVIDLLQFTKTPVGPVTLSFSGDTIDAYVVEFNKSAAVVDNSAIVLQPGASFESVNFASNAKIVSGLYEFALNRLPDSGGSAFWLGKLLNNEATKLAEANVFLSVPEFTEVNPGSESSMGFVLALNKNGETPYSSKILQGWASKLDAGLMTRAEVLIDMIEHQTSSHVPVVGVADAHLNSLLAA